MSKRMIWLSLAAIVAMVLGGTSLASAGANDDSRDSEHRRHAIHGRDFVWQAPSETPYALTGQERKQAASDRDEDRAPSFEHRGRSGVRFR